MNAVEAGLRFVFAVTGKVEREDSESIGGFRGRRWDLHVLIKTKNMKLLETLFRGIKHF